MNRTSMTLNLFAGAVALALAAPAADAGDGARALTVKGASERSASTSGVFVAEARGK